VTRRPISDHISDQFVTIRPYRPYPGSAYDLGGKIDMGQRRTHSPGAAIFFS
jgi:hypothetical protein